MEILFERFYEKYNQVNTETIRNFINRIDWSNRFLGIKGSRGVGKTTLILQYLRKNYKPDGSVLYVSLDHLYFAENKLYDLADQFYKKGGKLLALDEVHRYPGWSQELKNIYDDFPELKVIFTGSSLLQLHKAGADLSRRVVMYSMPGLSFREFLHFETGENLPVVSLDDLLINHVTHAMELSKVFKPLARIDDYISYGYYPFYLENKEAFHQKLDETIQAVLEVDIPQFENIQTSNIFLLKRLLQLIASSVPFKPNLQTISQRTGISINTIKNYLQYLQNARLISMLQKTPKGLSNVERIEKIYLHNTNLMSSLVAKSRDTGSIRETFFNNQMGEDYKVYASERADFLVNDKYHFEIGGKSKTGHQIKSLENAFIVKDNIEIGHGNIIPLWLFGFLY